MNNRVLIAMSGGVDSTVAVQLLKRTGAEVVGVNMHLFGDKKTADADMARQVAASLGIEFYQADYSGAFKCGVIDAFVNSYLAGDTPNPCVECNKKIKFGELMRFADEKNCARFSTGHYALTEYDAGAGRWLLRKGTDRTKDQTYVLYNMTQEQLSRTIFPAGSHTKDEIRQIAQELGLVNADKADSQDICFIPDGDYKGFIERYTGEQSPEGDFVDTSGKILGRHKGIIGYTTGQRKGLGVSADRPLYVLRKDLEKNQVVLGDNVELFTKRLLVKDVNFIAIEELKVPMRVEAKIRYSQKTAPAVISPDDNGNVVVEFETPQRAATSGQSAVFYDGDIVVGGGVIVG